MTVKNPIPEQQTKKGNYAITTSLWLAVIGVCLVIGSIIPFTMISTMLGNLEADGSFDSLNVLEYQQITELVRWAGICLVLCAIIVYIFRIRLERPFSHAADSLRSISIRKDLQTYYLTIYSGRQDILPLAGLAGITLFGLFLRLIQLQRPVGYDEAYTFMHFGSRAIRYIVTDYSGPNNHIFHSLLVSLSYHLFGNSLWALRLPAMSAGVLCIPAGYLAGKRLFNHWSGLIAAVCLALMPMLVDYSDNARGYTLICLFSIIGLWMAAELTRKNLAAGWLILSITCILGFYTIPTFLYPFGVIFVWLGLSALQGKTGGLTCIAFLTRLLFWGLFTGVSVFILYSPVFFFGTGIQSIIGNEFVQSLTWPDFRNTLSARIPKVWDEWWFGIPVWIKWFSVGGFFLSFLSIWNDGKTFDPSRSKLPLIVPAILWIGLSLIIQRVVPLARVWMFLLAYYLIVASAGWGLLADYLCTKKWGNYIITASLVALTLVGYLGRWNDPTYSTIERGFDYSAAVYLHEHLIDDDTILAVAPGSIRVGYYLYQMGVPYSRFYDRARPEPVSKGYIVVIEKSKYDTPESILAFHNLDDLMDNDQIQLVFKEKRMQVYRLFSQ